MAKRAPAARRPRKAKPGTRGLTPAECRLEQPEGAAAAAAAAVEKAGGCVVGLYKEPLGGHQTLLSNLPWPGRRGWLATRIRVCLLSRSGRPCHPGGVLRASPALRWRCLPSNPSAP